MGTSGLLTDLKAIEGAGTELDLGGFAPSLLAEPLCGQALRAYLALSQRASYFLDMGCSPEAVFWSRYFWFRRFAALRMRNGEADAGIEQQGLEILEHPYPECAPDWSRLQDLEEEANAV
jgi:hypothetical protein